MKNIDEVERKFIVKDLGQSGQKISIKEIPWLQIVQNVSFIGLCLTGFCQGINDFIMLEMMPQYLSHVKVSFVLFEVFCNFQIFGLTENGLSSAAPVVTNVICAALGCVSIDYILQTTEISRTTARKTSTIIGLVPAILLICLFTYVQSLTSYAVFIFTVVYGLRKVLQEKSNCIEASEV